MAAQILDKNTAWALILEAVNRSNVILPLPGSDDVPALELERNGDWRLPARGTGRTGNLRC